MKILIMNKEDEMIIDCNNVSIKDGMLIIEKPVIENGATSEEVWIPVANISMVSFIEKNKDTK